MSPNVRPSEPTWPICRKSFCGELIWSAVNLIRERDVPLLLLILLLLLLLLLLSVGLIKLNLLSRETVSILKIKKRERGNETRKKNYLYINEYVKKHLRIYR